MRTTMIAALAGLLAVAACSDSTGPAETALTADDAAFVATMSAEVGALGDHLGPALRQLRRHQGDDGATGPCQEMQQLREQLRQRLQEGDQEGAAQVRLQLRLEAARMIRAGLGDEPLRQMLRENERDLAQLRLQIRLRASLHADTTVLQERLRTMLQLQEQVQLALQEGRPDAALELAARIREQCRELERSAG
ncbi:MAG TPA: hypothetical protein VK939_14170 [Longimicrobiales bacterium]|nr:hypothetical protein [Longimicrobiales bacterium]